MTAKTMEELPWPGYVTVLDSTCNISGPYGNPTEGYPNYTTEWLRHELRFVKGEDRQLMLLIWEAHCDALRRWLEHIGKHKNRVDLAQNLDGKTFYNLVWAHLGYIDGQNDEVLELAQQAKDPVRPQFLMKYNEVTRLRIEDEPKKKKANKPKFKKVLTKKKKVAKGSKFRRQNVG